MVEGGRTPLLPAERLKALGYAIAIWPAAGFLAAAAALEKAYAEVRTTGSTLGLPADASFGFQRMTELMGFPEVYAFETRWSRQG
jgi:2-methylisocitrate lyase-like PEP mutase family enzyme